MSALVIGAMLESLNSVLKINSVLFHLVIDFFFFNDIGTLEELFKHSV